MKARDIEKRLDKSLGNMPAMDAATIIANGINYTARNKLSRQRGYAFENWIVKEIGSYPYWGCRRLGGSSTGLPDVMASYAKTVPENKHASIMKWKTIIMAIEAKEGEDNTLYVEREQIKRCYAAITALWQSIDDKWILLAFKFLRNKTQYKARTQTLLRFILLPYVDIANWLVKYYNSEYVKILFRYDIRKEELSIIQYDSQTGNKATMLYGKEASKDYEMFDNIAELIGYVVHV